MRKTIVRTITATTIYSANVTFEKGAPVVKENAPLTINGVVNDENALKAVRKEFGAMAQVTNKEEVNDVYEISVSDFIKYATKVVAPTPEQTTEGATE